MPVIEINNISKSFGDNHVLNNFSMQVEKGENLAILGKSGSGKSVLIKCIIRLLKVDSGFISLLGEDVSVLAPEKLNELRSKVGFLFQSNALYDSLTVRENLKFPLRRHWSKDRIAHESEKAVTMALEDVGLPHTADKMPAELSGGMRKRIALARTLILQPEIILYDEPTTGLDPVTAREISLLIVAVQKKYNASSVIISHDMNCIRITSNRVIMLREGKCYANDSFKNLQASRDQNISEFFD